MAFSRFPECAWRVILEQLDTVQDISNVFEAYPEMRSLLDVFKSKRNNWYFSLIFPHVFPWLKPGEVSLCREVSKQWCQSVDHFLENHPSRRAYNPEAQPQPWIPILKTPSTYYPPLWACRNKLTREWETSVGIPFSCPLNVRHFLRESTECNYPHERNPFIGRAVRISDYLWTGYRGARVSELSPCWDMIINVFQRYGAHIWFLDIARTYVDYEEVTRNNATRKEGAIERHDPEVNPIDFSDMVLDCLNFAPNLISLQLKRTDPYLKTEKQLECDVSWMPALPHLETLGINSSDLPEDLVNILVMSYSSQIKSLSIEGKFWRDNYSNLFPKLTELKLEGFPISEEKINNLFLSLEAPQLCKLHLHLSGFVVEELILPWLKRFPRLESLALDILYNYRLDNYRKKRAVGEASSDRVDSLKHLWINNYVGGNYNDTIIEFLGSFPSLESLAIYPKLRFSGCFKHENIMCEPTLWRLLPKLKKIVILGSRYLATREKHTVYRRPVNYE